MPTPVAADPEASLAAYLEELQRQHYSLSAQDQARLVLPRFFSHLRDEGVLDLRKTGEEHLASFATRLREAKTRSGRPLSDVSRSDYLQVVRRFLLFLEKRGILLRSPTITLPRPRTLPRAVLTEAEARRLMAAPFPSGAQGIRDRAILEAFYGTAIRLSECARLDLSDLDLKERLLLVRNGKGRKDRVVPVPGRAQKALDLYLREARPDLAHDSQERALFLSRTGSRLGTTSYEILVRRYAQAAGIAKRVTPHLLRHTCATHLLEGGASLRHIQKLLGHQALDTTALYSRVSIRNLKAVLRRAHPREAYNRVRKRTSWRTGRL